MVLGDESLTYRELSKRVEHLAVRLRRCGVRRNVPVGIRLERSLNLLVSTNNGPDQTMPGSKS